MELTEFVQSRFGADVAANLLNIRTGGENNQKGGLYEDFFAVFRMCAIAAQESNLDQYWIAAQEFAFVDDLCIKDYSRNTKTNYQAKNSSGKPAEWTHQIEERFRRQACIDREFFNFHKSIQVLLVSCNETAIRNQEKIPEDAKDIFRSEFFPYEKSSSKLIIEHDDLRKNLEIICDSTDLSVIDSAFRIVLGVWRSDQDPATIHEIFFRARKESKPDLFQGLIKQEISVPQWLAAKCQELQGIDVRLGAGRYLVTFNGLEVSFPVTARVPDTAELDEILSVDQFLVFLMLLATTELKT